MAEYRELHYPGDVTADLPPGEPLGWDATGRPYVIVQAWYDPPNTLDVLTHEHVEPVASITDGRPGRTTVVLAAASPEQVRGWIDSGAWHPDLLHPRTPSRVVMQFAAHRADLRAAAAN